jgi:2,4-dienoyl-CoA reductase-like NADH-dependent reductase (Old Yellow Enzyme family)
MKTNTLFTPLELGSVSLSNRIVRAPTPLGCVRKCPATFRGNSMRLIIASMRYAGLIISELNRFQLAYIHLIEPNLQLIELHRQVRAFSRS